MLYSVMGWLNILILAVMTAPFWLRILQKATSVIPNAAYTQWSRRLRAVHKPLGLVILTFAGIHGWLALGTLLPHTGTLLFLMLAVTASLGLLFYRTKKKNWFLWHKRMALVAVCALALHLLAPNALYYLF